MSDDIHWIPVGPAPQDPGANGVSGRPWCITISPNFDRAGNLAMFLGIAGGGVWRSTDFQQAAPTWKPLTDHFPATIPLPRQVNLQVVGALAVDPNQPWIIYAGTGDPDDRGPNIPGNGILKSIDGGDTWTLLDVGPVSADLGFTLGFSRIFVDPGNSSVLYAAGAQTLRSVRVRGIFRSIDGGINWSSALGNLPLVDVADLDYTIDNSGQLRLLVAVHDATERNPAANGVWQSNDAGQTWTQMPIALIDVNGAVAQPADIGLLDLAADRVPGSPNGAYLAISRGSSLLNVFKLAGDVWRPAGNSLPAMNTNSAQSIGLAPDGSVYLGGSNYLKTPALFQTRDGGASWTSIDVGSNGLRPHTDQHTWAFFGGAVYSGNDGGIYRFTPLPSGAAGPGTWESLNTGSLQTILTEYLGIHPRYPNVMLQGSQDNDLALRRSGEWMSTTIGENARCRFDPFDGNFAYSVAQPYADTAGVIHGAFNRSIDGGATFQDVNVPNVKAAQNSAPFAFHPDQPGRIALGLDRVFETRDRGDTWKTISRVRAGNDTLVTALAYQAADQIYIAYSNRLFKTIDGGGNADDANWPELNPGNDWGGRIESIVVDPKNRDHVYLAARVGAIWRSADAGATWFDITNDFPRGTLSILKLDLRSDRAAADTRLFVATSVGVFSAAPGEAWTRFGEGLPDASVWDLQFNQTNKYLVAGLHGRGMFAANTHFITDLAVGAGAVNDVVFCFAADRDGHVCVNQARFGEAFVGWFGLPSAWPADAAPAGTSVSDRIFCFIKGVDNKIYISQAKFGHEFSRWDELQGDGRTNDAPSAATIGNHVFAFIRGTDDRVYVNQADLGQAFGNWRALQDDARTDAAPAAAVLRQNVFVFIKRFDQRIFINQAEFGHEFSGWLEVQGDGRTDRAPAAAALKDVLFVFVKGLDKRIYVNQAPFGDKFQPRWAELQGGGMTDTAPCAVAIRDSLFVFVRGLDGRIYLNQAEYGNAFSGWRELGGGIR